MTDAMHLKKSDLHNCFAMACPRCGNSTTIYVNAMTTVRLTTEGTVDYADHEWDDSSFACCYDCHYEGEAGHFRLHQCGDCLQLWHYRRLKEIKHNYREGEEEPSGQCPDCGALCHEITDTEEIEEDNGNGR